MGKLGGLRQRQQSAESRRGEEGEAPVVCIDPGDRAGWSGVGMMLNGVEVVRVVGDQVF